MSKRDDDAQGDMEVGMTTAERRRRRRRASGLRIPSDNVPRSRTSTAPPPPVPEDPALAMSIAYSFTSDASGPVQRAATDVAPMAPEAMPTVIDPPRASGSSEDFEMNTREMSAVDLEALGLQNESTAPFQRGSAPRIERAEVDVDMSDDEPVTTQHSPLEEALRRKSGEIAAQKIPGQRHKTVALSEDDIEVIRAASQPGGVRASAPAMQTPAPATARPDAGNRTQPLSAVDVEVVSKSNGAEEPTSVPDVDIEDLADRVEASGEFEVDVEDEPAPPPKPAPVAAAAPTRSKSPSQPPPLDPARVQARPHPPAPPQTKPGVAPANADAAHAASASAAAASPAPAQGHAPAPPAATHGASAGAANAHPPATPGHHPPPPPPPAAAHKPPAPPQKKPVPQAAVAAVVAKEPSRPVSNRARQWFVELFDEDYLRTLPFLTPQATQAEAEFVINAMNLAPGAQVLDLGCGYGRHAMELAARGFHVVGLDLSTPLLVRGGEEAHRRGLTINFVRGDMRELDFEAQFDASYCLFSTFGYFDDETNKKTLQNVARALKPGGKVLVEILNRDYLIADLPTRVWWEGDGCVVLEEVELNYFSSRIQVNRSVVFDDGRQLEQEISVRAYSLHEVGKLMHAAGFRVLEVSGGYQMKGRFLGNQSRHIIVLAEKKETSGS